MAIISFGLGFFFGYRGGEVPETGQQAAEERPASPASPASKVSVPDGERRVIDDSPAPSAPAASAGPASPAPLAAAAPKAAVVPGPGPSTGLAFSAQVEQDAPSARAAAAAPPGREAGDAAGAGRSQEKLPGVIQPKVVVAPPIVAAKPGAEAQTPARPQDADNPQKAQKTRKVQKAAAPKKQYTIQVGAFPNRTGAEQLQQRLKESGYKAYIVDADKGSDYYKVRVGAFKGKKEAERVAAMLRKKTAMQNFITTVKQGR
ncbi:MAG: SPOR domain-containing protein [Nitrospirota bacterium]